MKSQTPNIPLTEKAKQRLLEIATEVSRQDKKDAHQELTISPMTIGRYLRGDVRDIGTATRLIEFFKKRIDQRKRIVA